MQNLVKGVVKEKAMTKVVSATRSTRADIKKWKVDLCLGIKMDNTRFFKIPSTRHRPIKPGLISLMRQSPKNPKE